MEFNVMKLVDFKNENRFHAYDRSINYQLQDKIMIFMNFMIDSFNIQPAISISVWSVRNIFMQNVWKLRDQLNETISYKS
jgi:hypothetical protein